MSYSHRQVKTSFWFIAISLSMTFSIVNNVNAGLIWDGNIDYADGVQETAGNWQDGGAANWRGAGPANEAWSNAALNGAQFGNAVSTTNVTVTVDGGGVTASGLVFKRSYTLQGGPVTLSGTAPEISCPTGATNATTATLTSNLIATNDLILRGAAPTLSSSYYKFVLGGANTYSGNLILHDSALADINSATALSSTGTGVIVDAGSTLRILAPSGTFGAGQTLQLSGNGFGNSGNLHNSRAGLMLAPSPSGSLTWAGNIVLNTNSSIASSQTTAGTVNTISGNISGSGKLTKTSDKTLALTGTCTYTGGTDIYRNVLQVDGTLGTAGSTVTVGTGTYTDAALKGIGSITGDVLVNTVGTLEAGDSIGTLTLTGNVTVNGKFKVEYDSFADTIDKLVVNGDLNLGGATMTFSEYSSTPDALATGVYVFATYTGTLTQPTAVPTGIPAGFDIDWAYSGNSIALSARAIDDGPAGPGRVGFGGLSAVAIREINIREAGWQPAPRPTTVMDIRILSVTDYTLCGHWCDIFS